MDAPLIDALRKSIVGDVDISDEALTSHSRDASLFTVQPQVVVYPKNAKDVGALVRFVAKNKSKNPILSLTARAGGTCMSGGPINNSIIVDFTRYMNKVKEVTDEYAVVEPGCYYRDFEKETLKRHRIMPTYPASREICAVGGMVANNSGGEKSIKYGETESHIKALKVVFADGKEYTVVPLTLPQLKEKIATGDFEGDLYKKLFDLIDSNYALVMGAKPDVSKNSSGYYLWNVYNKETGVFDLCRLVAGSQGTLGLVTEITFELVPVEPYSGMLVAFLPDLSQLSQMINEILPFKPDSLESYDDYSMKLAIKFSFDFFKQLGFFKALQLGFQFIPDAWAVLLTGRVPKLILLVEFTGASETAIYTKLKSLEKKLAHYRYKTHIAKSNAEEEKYWKIRRESFNLLRKHVHGKRTAPFIEDIIVKPEYLPEVLPQVQKMLDEYKLVYTVAGHPGNGNFHIIPLMDMKAPYSVDTILDLSKKVYDLVHEYHGSISAEHNDGIIRTPYLPLLFGKEMVALFEQTKKIFDPLNIFNPGKKVGGTFADIKRDMIKTIA